MITKPTLFIDKTKCKENIQRMCSKAKTHQLELRPHFKSHQSLEIGRWFKDFGVNKITVSSLAMADYFSSEWEDITVAFPTNILEIETINDLAGRINLNLIVEAEDTLAFLSENLTSTLGVFIKVDIGYHRTGVAPENLALINQLLSQIDASDKIQFKGFLGHAGHTYKCRTNEGILEVHQKSLEIMARLKNAYGERYPGLIISVGDTPSCSVAENFEGVDEIRPGNFVFYDLAQNKIGSNDISQIAVAMACPVVAIHKDRLEIVVYGGGVHFSKDRLEGEKEGTVFGRVVEQSERGWGDIIPGMYVKSLSQEHGIISVPGSMIDQYKIGDCLMVLPVHICMTANLMKSYHTFDNEVISRL
ncbi:alanine racemase [Rapidithrix thailandica]|uniref:Alanine racemase n=1 Tax=Rapidithrix thailandica TaxID=413964 RepID=A0AAW9SE59_9BACT